MAAALLLLGACHSRPDVANPTGSCGTRDDNGSAGYAAPSDATWVPDCANTLRREYWRVLTPDAATAYVLPRPDGIPELRPACDDPQHELHAITERYGLCAAAGSAAEADVVNHMDLSDALRVTHFLHAQLKFVVTTDAVGIAPFPLPADVIAGCALHATSPDLETLCRRERERVAGGPELPYGYAGPGGPELVSRLNELYGIAP